MRVPKFSAKEGKPGQITRLWFRAGGLLNLQDQQVTGVLTAPVYDHVWHNAIAGSTEAFFGLGKPLDVDTVAVVFDVDMVIREDSN